MLHQLFPACGDFCHLLITFANSLDPDQAQQIVGPDLDPNRLILWWYSQKNFLKMFIFEKKKIRQKKNMQNYSACNSMS